MDITKIFELSETKEESPAVVRERAGSAMNFYNFCFKKQLQKMIFNQFNNIGKPDLSYDFIKGTLNGLGLVEDWFKLQEGIAKTPEEKEED